jgi:hypothetical protein
MIAGLAAPSRYETVNNDRSVCVNESYLTHDNFMDLSLEVDNADVVEGGYISITYDNSLLTPIAVSSESGVLLESNIDKAGVVRIAFAGMDGLISKSIAKIRFECKNVGNSKPLLKEFELYDRNGYLLHTQIKDILPNVNLPDISMLLQNYPNPFNPDTWIPYQLSEPCKVTISIYDMSGHLLRKLDLGYRETGFYVSKDKAAHWDGKNEAGENVSSGVYFCQIKAGLFSKTEKLLIVR